MAQPAAFDTWPPFSAEMPYFRVPRDDWELMLARMRQLGANTIATSVPWVWHEPQPSALDLAGTSHPQRDLLSFVQLCGRLGFSVILKPGPYLKAGLLGGGVPPWLLRTHPEIQALHSDGRPRLHPDGGTPYASALHPTYLAAARSWMAAFSAAARALQYPAGPIIAIQVDSPVANASGPDPRFRFDYNTYVVETLWPAWLRERHGEKTAPKHIELPSPIQQPLDLEELRRYLDLETFTDWRSNTAVATVVGWLREDGWTIPLLVDLPLESWHAGSKLTDTTGLVRTACWSNQLAPAHKLLFNDYVYSVLWRTRLARQPGASFPTFAPQISAAQDFAFAAPFIGGLQGANIAMALQTQTDNPGAGAFIRWAMEAPVRSDGSIRASLWNAKAPFTLLGAAGADFAAALEPADLALGYSHVPERVEAWAGEPKPQGLEYPTAGSNYTNRSQALARRLVRAGVAFAVLDLDAATEVDLARYALVAVPAAEVLAQATQAKLARCNNVIVIGDARTRYDENLEACEILEGRGAENKEQRTKNKKPRARKREPRTSDASDIYSSPIRLPEDVSVEQLGELIEERGGSARYAWADAEDVDVSVYYGDEHTYLFVANRRPALYSGALTYRAPDGSLQHLHLGIGGLRIGMMILKDSQVLGTAIGGDGSEGGWLVRGMHTSMVFNNGAGVIAPCGASLLLSAPQSGRFQIRRPAGWEGMLAYRLLLSGALLPASFQIEAAHLAVPYVAEDEHGQTDLYILTPEQAPLPDMLHAHTATLLAARATALQRAVALAAATPGETPEAVDALALAAKDFALAAHELEQLAACTYTLDQYAAAWQAADAACRPAIAALSQVLTQARSEQLAGALDEALYRGLEERIVRILGIEARGSLAHDRER